ncbi:MAG TPA: hypothetical protein VGC22_05620 [Chitinophaga sp.]
MQTSLLFPASAPAMHTLFIARHAENSRHTYGAFKMTDAANNVAITGYTLEPGGLSGPFHLSGKRLPAGAYRLDWQYIPGEGNRLVLFNGRLPAGRLFQLNHTGALPENKGYLVLSRQPIYEPTNAMGFSARSAGFELEALLRKVGVTEVEVRVTDY